MDREIWCVVLRATRSLRAAVEPRRRPVRYSDRSMLRFYLWLSWRGLPLCRVIDRSIYGSLFRPRDLPSVSQFCRRVAQPRFAMMLEHVRRRLLEDHAPAAVLCLDGKALPVSENTRDPQATTGHGNGRFCRGYRLNVVSDDRGQVLDYRITSMHVQEKSPAYELIGLLRPGQLLLADGNYDSSGLYDAVASRGAFLLTPLKGRARSATQLARMSAARREAIKAWSTRRRLCERVYQRRGAIERTFANLVNFAGGLSSPPTWVRTLRRVQHWVAAKLIIYQARRLIRLTAVAS